MFSVYEKRNFLAHAVFDILLLSFLDSFIVFVPGVLTKDQDLGPYKKKHRQIWIRGAKTYVFGIERLLRALW
jgi:hypothetical protein